MSRPILVPNPALVIFTDASLQGWGCHIPATGLKSGGRWTEEERQHDINYLELKAVSLALQTCCKSFQHTHILINIDNTTTVVSVNRQGSTHSLTCNDIPQEIWIWAMATHNWISATHCPGVFNRKADNASRLFNDSTEWMLDRDTFNYICQTLGYPDIDLFASRLNFMLKPYCVWQPDPGAVVIDCFTFDWNDYNLPYAFPPFRIIGKTLQKIQKNKIQAVIIVPQWATQPWYSKLQEMLVHPPITIPVHRTTLQLPHDLQTIHPLVGRLKLLACKVSVMYTNSKASLTR